jgi:hypothetical protein
MTYFTGQVTENGIWFVIVVAVLSFFWFHHRSKRHQAGRFKRL